MSCKFYVAVPVALTGVMIWWCYGNRRVGLWTAGLALAYLLLAFFVIRPWFTTEQTSLDHRNLAYLSYYFDHLELIWDTWASS